MSMKLYETIAPLIARRTPISQSAYLKQFYGNLIDWVDEGIPKNNIHGFTTRFGLLVNLKFWAREVFSEYNHAERVAITEQLIAEMREQFGNTGLALSHPFNFDRVGYLAEKNTFNNALRLYWVRCYAGVPAHPIAQPKVKQEAESGFARFRRKIGKFLR